jgi:hypothetical protein
MRLGRLVAAGLILGAAAGFAGALLRPRTVRTYGIDTGRAAGAAPALDTAPAAPAATPESTPDAGRVVDISALADARPDAADSADPVAGAEGGADVDERRVVAAAARSRGTHG